MEYVIPTVPLEVQQRILKELILARDPEATFSAPEQEPEPDPEPASIGQ